MNKQEIATKILTQKNGIAKTADFAVAHLSNNDISSLCKLGVIKRIKRGIYTFPNESNLSEEQLLVSVLPQAIICVESALFYYGYSDFTPRRWSIAVPRTAIKQVKNTELFFLKAYYIQKEFINLGKTTGVFNGVELALYNRERTICDCFKYRTKLDNELFNKAMIAYIADDKKDLAQLAKYSKEMKIYNKVMSLMEVLLNG
ncbi:MAG: abortive phage infection protein [Treponema sp. CETP13]|nr:MAG: abortive phage infection protein [Treponema sp. CETP13]